MNMGSYRENVYLPFCVYDRSIRNMCWETSTMPQWVQLVVLTALTDHWYICTVNPDTAPLCVHCSLWRYVEGGRRYKCTDFCL